MPACSPVGGVVAVQLLADVPAPWPLIQRQRSMGCAAAREHGNAASAWPRRPRGEPVAVVDTKAGAPYVVTAATWTNGPHAAARTAEKEPSTALRAHRVLLKTLNTQRTASASCSAGHAGGGRTLMRRELGLGAHNCASWLGSAVATAEVGALATAVPVRQLPTESARAAPAAGRQRADDLTTVATMQGRRCAAAPWDRIAGAATI